MSTGAANKNVRTISELANRHGLAFTRQPERVPNRWGKHCTVTRYSLPESDQHVRADDDTERVKPRIGDVRDTANPGRAALQGIGCRFDKE